MKKNTTYILILSNAALVVGIMVSLYLQWSSQSKIAYIQTSQVIDKYQGMIDARKVYEAKAKSWKANIDTLAKEAQLEVHKFQKEAKAMTQKERKLAQELLQRKEQELVNYQKAIQQQAQQEDHKMTEEVLKEINVFLEEYGKSKGYEVILAATDMGNIAYGTKALDITEEVLAGLNGTQP